MKLKFLFKILCLILVFPVLLGTVACKDSSSDNEIALGYFVKNGVSDYKVLIPENAPLAIEQAADELVEYTKKSTGVNLQIETDNNYSDGSAYSYFSIGNTVLKEKANMNTDYSSLNGDGFVIKTYNNDIIVDAESDSGFLYGTYDFIENVLGVKFIAYDETYVPSRQEIKVYQMDYKSVPAFQSRVYLSNPVYKGQANLMWAAHSRTNTYWLNTGERYGYKSNVYSRKAETHNSRYYVPAELYGSEEIGYKGEYSEGHEVHNELYYVVPGKTPDYAHGGTSQGNVTINWLSGITEDGKLDTSMELSTAKVVIEEMKKDVIANPDAEYFVLDQEDFYDIVPKGHPLVEKYGASGIVVRFCNVIATEIQKWADAELNGRKINICTFAYMQSQQAPVVLNGKGTYEPIDETVVPVDNLYIRLALTSEMFFGYDDERQGVSVSGTFERWSAICSHFWFWGYDTCYNDYVCYCPSLGSAYGTVQYMRDLGVVNFLMQSSYNTSGDWQSLMKSYVWNKLLWNPDQNVSTLVDEFLSGYYSIAAPYVREIMNGLDAHFAKSILKEEIRSVNFWPYGTICTENNVSAAVLENAIAAIERAEDFVNDNNDLSNKDKKKLVKRLAAVKMTPKWMQLKFYSSLYPLADQREKVNLAQEVLDLSTLSGFSLFNETTGVAGYLAVHYGVY